MEKPVKNAVAFVIYHEDGKRFLIVKRPADDADLPNVWGLPAGSLKEEESFEDAVIRSGKEKLGVNIEVLRLLGKGEIERKDYVLHMKEYVVSITSGEPFVPQPVEGVTQYSEWEWGEAEDVKEAAQKGSLCSQLYLKSQGLQW